MSNEVKQDCKCCETCLNRISVSNNRYMCDKDLSDRRLADSVLKELPDGHVCDRYSPDIANNPSLRETKPNTEISGFMDIFHEIENTCELPCADGLTCNECDYFTKEDDRFNVDGVCCYYGIYLYDSAKNEACQHFKLTCCDDNGNDDTNRTADHYDSYFKSFEAINSDRTDEELADHYDSIDAMFKKDVKDDECKDSKHTNISDNCDKHCIRLDNPDYSEACQHCVERDKVHEEKHFCSECIFCAGIEPDENDQKTMYWSYTWKCLKTNLTLRSQDACEVCDKFVSKEDEYSNYLKAIEKPPLGIKPPYVFASERITDICEAILRMNQESVVADTDIIRSYASELCAISDYLDACMR